MSSSENIDNDKSSSPITYFPLILPAGCPGGDHYFVQYRVPSAVEPGHSDVSGVVCDVKPISILHYPELGCQLQSYTPAELHSYIITLLSSF